MEKHNTGRPEKPRKSRRIGRILLTAALVLLAAAAAVALWQKNNIEAVLQFGQYSQTELEEQLESKGFLRIHKSYLVNMSHLQKFQSQGAVLDDGTTLRVSERSYADQKRKYLFWRGL